MNYKGETPFKVTEDCSLVYNLKQQGWKKGNPVMVNDISIQINAPKEIREEIASIIRLALNRQIGIEDA